MIQHHPSEATLLAHAAGMLPEPHRIVMRTHLALCNDCDPSAHLATELGGVLFDALPPAEMSNDALARTLSRLGDRETGSVPRRTPTTAAEFATGRWWWLGSGLRLMPLRPRDADDARLDLIRVAPGVALPSHGHTGTELTCVLQGAFSDETGEYHTGDMAEGDADLQHQPLALATGRDCICLIATTGRLRAHGWLARLMQRLIGV